MIGTWGAGLVPALVPNSRWDGLGDAAGAPYSGWDGGGVGEPNEGDGGGAICARAGAASASAAADNAPNNAPMPNIRFTSFSLDCSSAQKVGLPAARHLEP